MISDLIFGSVTGLIGGIAGKVVDFKVKKLEIEAKKIQLDQEIQLRRVDAEVMREEWAQRTKVAEIEADATIYKASQNEPTSYSANIKPTEKQGWLLVALDVLRGSVRPVLTLYLCGIVTVLYLRTDGGRVDPQSIVDTVLYLATVCVSWWFGSRTSAAPVKK